jgi:hypothetical protein
MLFPLAHMTFQHQRPPPCQDDLQGAGSSAHAVRQKAGGKKHDLKNGQFMPTTRDVK